MSLDIKVRNNTEAGSYDATVDDRVVGMVVYEQRDNRVVIRHTIVQPDFRGRGVATTLVRAALDDLVANGRTLTNYCSFITDFIAEHQEYATLLDPQHPGNTPRFA